MIRLYAIIFIVALLGGAAYAAKYYYDTTHKQPLHSCVRTTQN